jgi:cell division protein FtsB
MAAEPRGEVCGRPSTENYAMTTPASAVRPDQTSEREYEREQGLIKRIKEQYAAVTDATKNIVARAIALGESLVEAKTTCGHGNFLQWLKTNCGISDKTAERYMTLAQNKAKLKPKLTEEKFDTMTNLTVNEALRLVGVKVGSGGGGGGAATYDKLEKWLVKKLKELPLDQLDDHIEKTYKTLKAAADAILAEKARKPLAA